MFSFYQNGKHNVQKYLASFPFLIKLHCGCWIFLPPENSLPSQLLKLDSINTLYRQKLFEMAFNLFSSTKTHKFNECIFLVNDFNFVFLVDILSIELKPLCTINLHI